MYPWFTVVYPNTGIIVASLTNMAMTSASSDSVNDTIIIDSPKLEDYNTSDCSAVLNLIYAPAEMVIQRMFYSRNTRLMMGYILPGILGIGLLGNLAFIFTLLRVRSMRTIINFYLLNLSVADLGLILVLGFRYTWTISNSPYVYTEPFTTDIGCVVISMITYTAYFGSMGFVNLVSYERYLAICHTFKHKSFNCKKRTARLIAAIWIIALVTASTVAPARPKMSRYCVLWPPGEIFARLPTSIYTCSSQSPTYDNYPAFLQGTYFTFALCFNVVLYTLIVMKLISKDSLTAIEENSKQLSQLKVQRQKVNIQVVRMLVLNTTCFFTCLMPFHFFLLQATIERVSDGKLDLLDSGQSSFLFWTAMALNCINSSANPFVYNIANERYRRALYEAFGYRKSRA